MLEELEFDHEGLPHNLSQEDILAGMTREQIEDMMKDPSQSFRTLSSHDDEKFKDSMLSEVDEEWITTLSEGTAEEAASFVAPTDEETDTLN